MKATDERQKVVTELINNIKILRLNSWVEKFAEYLDEKRQKEIKERFRIMYIVAMLIASNDFFPPAFKATTFQVYIATGHQLDLSKAFAVLTLFGLIDPLFAER